MSQERMMRVFSRGEKWCVQYGYYERSKKVTRFKAFREWPAESLEEAHRIAAREQIGLALNPIAVNAEPLPGKQHVARAIRESERAGDPYRLVQLALSNLPDPLPTPEESHQRLGVPCPHRRGGLRQFYVALSEPVYARLCAMAVAADTSRNRMVEALVMTAEED